MQILDAEINESCQKEKYFKDGFEYSTIIFVLQKNHATKFAKVPYKYFLDLWTSREEINELLWMKRLCQPCLILLSMGRC